MLRCSTSSLWRTVTQSPLRHTLGPKRHVSESTKSWPTSFDIPEDRMRALITIYHQSEQFITEENLDARIDEAFAPSDRPIKAPPLSLFKMQKRLERQQNAPKYLDDRSRDPDSETRSWTGFRSKRQEAAAEALLGTQYSYSGKNKFMCPGLEVLMEQDTVDATDSAFAPPSFTFRDKDQPQTRSAPSDAVPDPAAPSPESSRQPKKKIKKVDFRPF